MAFGELRNTAGLARRDRADEIPQSHRTLRSFKPLEDRPRGGSLRERDFLAIREETGKYLARPYRKDTAFDAFMKDSGQYAAIAQNWAKLVGIAPELQEASRVLDMTSATGVVSSFILSQSNREMIVFANEVSSDLREAALLRFQDLPHGGKGRTIVSMNANLASPRLIEEESLLSKGLDAVLWWGSFNMLAGREDLIGQAFELLRPNGRFVIMDTYPWEPVPERYLGRGAKIITTHGRALDMSDDVKKRVHEQWVRRVEATAGRNAASAFQINVLEFAETLKGQTDIEMRCLCFRKPEMMFTGEQSQAHL